MEYQIIETMEDDTQKLIGEGFQSITALWWAIVQEVNKRMAEESFKVDFVILKMEGQSCTAIGGLTLCPNGIIQMSMPI